MADSLLNYLFGALWVGMPPAALVFVIVYWMRSSPKIGEPVWRGCFAIGAATFAAISVTLWVFSFWYARKIGGFAYSDPTLMRFYRYTRPPANKFFRPFGFRESAARNHSVLFTRGSRGKIRLEDGTVRNPALQRRRPSLLEHLPRRKARRPSRAPMEEIPAGECPRP